ncbi:MAG: HAMP domain-containing protein [Candidatus Competibacterales bacterium]
MSSQADVSNQSPQDLKPKGITIFHQVFLSVFFAIMIPISLSGEFAFDNTILEGVMLENAERELGKTADLLSLRINLWVSDKRQQLSERVALYSSTNPARPGEMMNLIDEVDQLKRFVVMDGGDQIVADTGTTPLPFQINDLSHQIHVTNDNKNQQICIALPRNDAMAVGCFAIHQLEEIIAAEAIGQTGKARLINADGQVIGAPPSREESHLQQRRQIQWGQGWQVEVQRQRAEVIAPIYLVNRQVAVKVAYLMLSATPFALLFAYLLARRMVTPMEKLTQAIYAISAGKTETKIDFAENRYDEIGVLARSIRRLISSLQVTMGRLQPKI